MMIQTPRRECWNHRESLQWIRAGGYKYHILLSEGGAGRPLTRCGRHGSITTELPYFTADVCLPCAKAELRVRQIGAFEEVGS